MSRMTHTLTLVFKSKFTFIRKYLLAHSLHQAQSSLTLPQYAIRAPTSWYLTIVRSTWAANKHRAMGSEDVYLQW